MPKKTIVINSIIGGQSPSYYFGLENQFNTSLAIDPDFPISSSNVRTSGILVPIAYETFSSSAYTSPALWITTNPKNTNIYAYLANGRILSYSSSLGSETNERSVSNSSGNGFAYYNNFIYYARDTDIGRYGPLNNSPAFNDTFWTSTLSLTALTNTTYPSIRSTAMPNHPMYAHSDGKLYIGDVVNGQGVIHFIKTKKVTDEGDTNDTVQPSTRIALDLPFGFYPTSICSGPNGVDLAILAIQTSSNTTVNQGNAALFLWDTVSDSFYKQISISDSLATACINRNGQLYVFSGSANNGIRVIRYLGGDSWKTEDLIEEGTPPFAGAVDSVGDRLVWGAYTTIPETSSCVFSLGSKNPNLPMGRHNIIKTKSAGANPLTTALKLVQQESIAEPRLIVAWRDDTTRGLDRLDTDNSETLGSVWRKLIVVGKRFVIRTIRYPLAKAVAANMTLTPKIYVDDASSSTTLTVINSTNYPNSDRFIRQEPKVFGKNNFELELKWTGTVSLPVSTPIIIDLEILDP